MRSTEPSLCSSFLEEVRFVTFLYVPGSFMSTLSGVSNAFTTYEPPEAPVASVFVYTTSRFAVEAVLAP